MHVVKRDMTRQAVDFNKITKRIAKLIKERSLSIDPIVVAQKVCISINDNIKTTELDKLSAEICMSMSSQDLDYNTLAAAITVSDMHKNNQDKTFIDILRSTKNIDPGVLDFAEKNREVLEKEIDYEKDYSFDFFGIKTLEKSYLAKDSNGYTAERPQDLFMRVSLGIHCGNIRDVLETYTYMSDKKFIHATPTLYNAGLKMPQLASCFLQDIGGDSISSIYKTLADSAQISKYAGGIGIHIHNIRSQGSEINNVPNMCKGIVPMLKVFNETAKYVNQKGKRPGSIAFYLQVDHPDIFDFLDMKKNTGDEDDRARDLFYALWIPDLFMRRVRDNGRWSLFCPHTAPGLSDVYGEEYDALYLKYESQELFARQIKAQELWFAICTAQMETGTPYMLYKDAINKKSNQKNVGTIKSSNLCSEIVQYTSPEETAVCNLASICLPQYVREDGTFDFKELRKVARILTRNLNKVIDTSFYPTPEAKRSNLRHRPIGIGVQGLADAYILMGFPFESQEARELNKIIFETIYIGAVEESINLAKSEGEYETYGGSPMSEGKLQFDLNGYDKGKLKYKEEWEGIREEIKRHGVRNSLLIAPMPTASTSQIMGNNECIEPYTSNIYVRRTIAGEFTVINKHLMKKQKEQGKWDPNELIKNRGETNDELFKTVWQISQKAIIDQAADRQNFICQSQSMNLFLERPSIRKITSMHFYAWESGLKTGMYYLRTKPASEPIQYTVQESCEMCSG
jgi:ribonucleoside-diphosphate reductase alpha subunit